MNKFGNDQLNQFGNKLEVCRLKGSCIQAATSALLAVTVTFVVAFARSDDGNQASGVVPERQLQ
jgi:hypothetical protein